MKIRFPDWQISSLNLNVELKATIYFYSHIEAFEKNLPHKNTNKNKLDDNRTHSMRMDFSNSFLENLITTD